MTAPPFPSAYTKPAASPGFMLYRVGNRWQARQRAALAPLGLTHGQAVLLVITAWLTRDQAGERPLVTQIDLARFGGLDVMMTSTVLRTLAARDLITRSPHPTDARANVVHLTPAGSDLAHRALQTMEATDAAFFAALGADAPAFTDQLANLLSDPPRDDSIGGNA